MKRNRRKITVTVTAQTLYHLQELAAAGKYKDLGRVVDMLTIEHQAVNQRPKKRKDK